MLLNRGFDGFDHICVDDFRICAVFAHAFAIGGDLIWVGQHARLDQLTHDRRHATRTVIILAQVFTRRL